jgi:NTP pyrophosphatase (non-canonical NTP hydrolase)
METMTRSIDIMDSISARLKMTPDDKERYLWLALAGEVGEACNLVKKQWRDGFTQERVEKLKTELADVYIYLRILESFYGLDVHACAQEKMKLVESRPYANPENKNLKLPDTQDVLKELESLRAFKRSVDEALNSGDGTYRP